MTPDAQHQTQEREMEIEPLRYSPAEQWRAEAEINRQAWLQSEARVAALTAEIARLREGAQARGRRACECHEPDPVMQADAKFYCHRCSLETGARPSLLPEMEVEARIRALEAERDAMQRRAESAEADWQAAEAEIARLREHVREALVRSIAVKPKARKGTKRKAAKKR